MRKMIASLLIALLSIPLFPAKAKAGTYTTTVLYYVPTPIANGVSIDLGLQKNGPHLGGVNFGFLNMHEDIWDFGTYEIVDTTSAMSTYDAQGNYLWHQQWDHRYIDKSAPFVNGYQDWVVSSYTINDDGTAQTNPTLTYSMSQYLIKYSNWNIQVVKNNSLTGVQNLFHQFDDNDDFHDDFGSLQLPPWMTRYFACLLEAIYVCSDSGVWALGPYIVAACIAFETEICLFWTA